MLAKVQSAETMFIDGSFMKHLLAYFVIMRGRHKNVWQFLLRIICFYGPVTSQIPLVTQIYPYEPWSHELHAEVPVLLTVLIRQPFGAGI